MLTLLVGAGGGVREKLGKPRWIGRASEGVSKAGGLGRDSGDQAGRTHCAIPKRHQDRKCDSPAIWDKVSLAENLVIIGWSLLIGFWSLRVHWSGLCPVPHCATFLRVPASLRSPNRRTECWSSPPGIDCVHSGTPAPSVANGGFHSGDH